jgi:hypothetical protein
MNINGNLQNGIGI